MIKKATFVKQILKNHHEVNNAFTHRACIEDVNKMALQSPAKNLIKKL